MTPPASSLNRKSATQLLGALGVRAATYSLDGESRNDSYVLEEIYGTWHVYYFERGNRVEEQTFQSEAEACEELVRRVREDPTTRENYSPRASSLPGGSEA